MDYKEIITDIRKIVRSINLESKRILKDFGVSIPQLLCLTYLSKQEEYQLTHRQLVQHLHLNSSTVTGIVNRLEKKGYIARLPKKGDKRVTNIAITAAGIKVVESTPDLLHEKLSKHLQQLPDAQVKQIKKSLDLLIDVLGIRELDASPLLILEDPLPPEE
ncbi:MarR family winged helix-turn-helix transcriptional regulator [Chitinophaga japonensis]|uniref:DNA-binding MarR family transcriptional regulator n=1 Tax=Chitinophaga japonensis TaxID=104662 RepID=A0A562SS03_CHIJA|nr:MarR family transcriptional regulator [Chitinophaga japonensis]TWI84039.1 DNA-binding MarR family transcriptional regulator [Chitinophaga japonensis]